jgi:hypothetical protein
LSYYFDFCCRGGTTCIYGKVEFGLYGHLIKKGIREIHGELLPLYFIHKVEFIVFGV